jgi:hypothetical protein
MTMDVSKEKIEFDQQIEEAVYHKLKIQDNPRPFIQSE